ncbi:MAG: GTP 3',8-cyclase MoaA [Candidatus Bathyarchaeota archaeon]|nr:GTP 3',8-cyclase MoaA [Candidatus Bathyarchaeota archaeon]
MTIRDSFGRPVENLRVSVTQRCNFKCIYCHREGQLLDYSVELSAEEIERIVRVAASLGVYGVKLTGGEPLLRKDIVDIVRRISGIPGIRDISMTTNGFFLKEYARQLREAGLSRVNVSLDTLDAEKFKMITGVDAHEKVIEGIIEASRAGLNPIKINMVLLRGVNCDEIEDMVKFTGEHHLTLQLIELEHPSEDSFYMKYHVSLDGIEDEIREKSSKIIIRSMHHRRKYILRGGAEVEFVKPMHNTEFCLHCNRIRLTSDGKLKPCLFRNDNLVDLLNPMRDGASDERLRDLFIEAINRRKPFFM